MSVPEYFSTEQKHAVEAFMGFLDKASGGFVYQIDGAAGTGKTELTKYILTRVKNSIVCASTNKACQVLTERLQTESVPVVTCHVFLNGVLRYTKDGKQAWKFNLNNVQVPDLIVLDEVSMVDQHVFAQYKFLLEFKNARILTLGDQCQLPPVQEHLTCFYECYPVNVSLKRNMRNNNDKYNNMLVKIRHIILNKMNRFTATNDLVYWLAKYTPTYTLQSFVNINDIPVEIFNMYKSNPTSMFLTHRTNKKNNTVKQLNLKIRSILHETQEKFIVGDKIIFTDYFDTYHTNDLETIIHVQVKSKTFYDYDYDTYELTLSDGNKVYSVYSDDIKRFDKHVAKVKQSILDTVCDNSNEIDDLWKQFYINYKNLMAPIDYAYALSIHKSQGSTYKQTFLYLSDFIWMLHQSSTREQFFKLLYVGLSRTQTNTIIF